MAVWSEIFTYHFRLQPEQQSVAALLWQGCNLGTRSSSYAVVLETWGILFISELNWEVFFRPSSTRGTESSVVQPVCECLLPLKEYLQISATLDVQFLNILRNFPESQLRMVYGNTGWYNHGNDIYKSVHLVHYEASCNMIRGYNSKYSRVGNYIANA